MDEMLESLHGVTKIEESVKGEFSRRHGLQLPLNTQQNFLVLWLLLNQCLYWFYFMPTTLPADAPYKLDAAT
jgi:hypothetical protein